MKKRASILLALTAIITGAVCYPINSATAAPILPIEASTNRLEYGVLTPGNSYTKTITITNNSEEQTSFNLSITNTDGTESSTGANIAEWLTFTSATEYTLAAEASTNISIRIKVPKDATAGGKYATLAASNSDNDSITLSYISAIISGADLKYGGEITGTNINWFTLSPKIQASATVKNTGNVDFDATAKLTVKSIFGGNPILEDTQTSTIYPSSTAEFTHELTDKVPSIGLYNTIQTITYINANAETIEHTTERIIIICPIWLIILAAVIIIAIIILIITLKKRNKKSHPKKSKKPSWEQPEN